MVNRLRGAGANPAKNLTVAQHMGGVACAACGYMEGGSWGMLLGKV